MDPYHGNCLRPVVSMGLPQSKLAQVAPATSSSTVCFPIHLVKESATPIGIVLEGNSLEAPTIIEISPKSIAARGKPRLQVGMKVLAVNGKRVLGPHKIKEELLAAVGDVWMEVEADSTIRTARKLARVQTPRVALIAGQRPSKVGSRSSSKGANTAMKLTGDLQVDDGHEALAVDPVEDAEEKLTASPRTPVKAVAAQGSSQLPEVFAVVLSNPQRAHSLGLILTGSASEPPTIVQVIEESIAASARPKLLPGMRILKVSGQDASGAGPTMMRALEISVESGEVAFEMDRAPDPPMSPRPSPKRSPSRRIGSRRWQRAEQKMEILGVFDNADSKDPATVSAARASAFQSLKVPAKVRDSMMDAVQEALKQMPAGEEESKEDSMGWNLEAWLAALEPHQVLSQGLQHLMQEPVRQAGGSYTTALEKHFVRTIGSMPDEKAMKILQTLIGHPICVGILAKLLLDGARAVAGAESQMSPCAVFPTVGRAQGSSSGRGESPSTLTAMSELADVEQGPGSGAEITAAESLGSPSIEPSIERGNELSSPTKQVACDEELNDVDVEREALRKKLEEAERVAGKVSLAATDKEGVAERARAALVAATGTPEEASARETLEVAERDAAAATAAEKAARAEADSKVEAVKLEANRLEKQRLQLLAQKRKLEEQAKLEADRREQLARAELERVEKQRAKEKRRLAEELFQAQQSLMQANLALSAGGTPVLLDRYVENNPAGFDLKYGSLEDFRDGLSVLLGAPAPSEDQAMSAMEAEHTTRTDSNTEFTVYNYGTVTFSKAEYYFVTDPSDERLAMLGLEVWPIDKKLRAANRPYRQARPVQAFRSTRVLVNGSLREAGGPPLSIDEFVACRLYTGPMCMCWAFRSHGPLWTRALAHTS